MHCFACHSASPVGSYRCERCGRLLDTDSDRYFKAGLDRMADGDMETAAELLLDCVQLDPGHLNGRYNLGTVLALLNRCGEAAEHLGLLARLCPDYPGVYTVLGQVAFGSYLSHSYAAEEARESMLLYLGVALEKEPDSLDACFTMGNACMALGDLEAARNWLEKARELQPRSAPVLFSLARVAAAKGEHGTARTLASAAVDLSGPGDTLREEMVELLTELRESPPIDR